MVEENKPSGQLKLHSNGLVCVSEIAPSYCTILLSAAAVGVVVAAGGPVLGVAE